MYACTVHRIIRNSYYRTLVYYKNVLICDYQHESSSPCSDVQMSLTLLYVYQMSTSKR